MYHMNYLKRVLTQLNANDVFYSFLCFLPLEIYNFFLMLIKIILLSGKGYVQNKRSKALYKLHIIDMDTQCNMFITIKK